MGPLRGHYRVITGPLRGYYGVITRTALDFHDAGTYTTSSFVRDDLQAYQVLVTVGFCREHTRVSKLFVASECKSVGRVNHIEQMIAMVIFHDTFI